MFLFAPLRVFFSAKIFSLIRYDANYNKRSGVGVEASEPTPTPTPRLLAHCHDSGDSDSDSDSETLFICNARYKFSMHRLYGKVFLLIGCNVACKKIAV